MKNAFWGYWLILLGVFIVVIMLLVQNITTSNTQDYYLVKEITEAALIDAVDYAYYRNYSEIRINKEKFYESFLRRFAETASLSTTYTINFYGIYEAPPKVSVEVKSVSSTFNVVGDSTSFDMTERLDAILEGNALSLTPGENVNLNNPSGGNVSGISNPNNPSGSNNNQGDNPSNSGNPSDEPTSDFHKTINAIRYSGSTSYYITTCTNGICKYTQENGNAKEGTISDTLLSTTPSASTNNEVTTSCKDDYTKIDASGLKGYGMVELSLQKDATGFNTAKRIKLIQAGNEFTIVGLSSNKQWMLVESGSDCGYVLASVVAVNLQEYLPKNGATNVNFNIVNKTGSTYFADDSKTRINNGKGAYLDGLKLYSGDHKPIAVYSFAQKVLKAAKSAQSAGSTLVIYDTYRPKSAADHMYNIYTAYLDNVVKGTQYQKDIDSFFVKGHPDYKRRWFLSTGTSTHNTACALDVTFAGANMPTAINVLNVAASPVNNGNADSKKLNSWFTSAGLSDLVSEWWHFQDTACHNAVLKYNSNGASFWSNY